MLKLTEIKRGDLLKGVEPGKTIMAGLYIRELMLGSDANRIMIVVPGSLVEQWQDELFEKFGLRFDVFSREMLETSYTGNPFQDRDLLIARLDQLSRSDELKEKLRVVTWDLMVVDEAHKMSASFFGSKIHRTAVEQHNTFLFIGFGFNDSQLNNQSLLGKLKVQKNRGLIITRGGNERIQEYLKACENLWLVCRHPDDGDEGTWIFNTRYADGLYLEGVRLWKAEEFAKEILGG